MKSYIFMKKAWFMKNHWFCEKSRLRKIQRFLWTIRTHEESWIFMNDHDSWKIMNFYEQSWLMKIHEFLWTAMTDFFGRLFWPKTWLFMTFWWHSGIILGPSRDHSKVILRTFRWLFDDFSKTFRPKFFGHQNWSGMIGASCRSCFVSINSHEPAINSHVPAINTHVPAINSS